MTDLSIADLKYIRLELEIVAGRRAIPSLLLDNVIKRINKEIRSKEGTEDKINCSNKNNTWSKLLDIPDEDR